MTTRRVRFFLLTSLTFCIALTVSAYGQSDPGKGVIARGYSDTHFEGLKNVNSQADEATPFVSADEGTLYFTSYRKDGKEAIYQAKRKSISEWGEPSIFMELPGKAKIGNISIAGDGKTCVFNCSDREDCLFNSSDIFEGEIDNGELKNIHSLGKTVNSDWWDAQPSISKDGQLMFFVSDRKHSVGKWDIYMCTRSNGGWSAPVDLSFNKSGHKQIAPFIASDNQTLYFAADYDGGEGGSDIYVTYRKGENEWTEPKNLGPAVNSKSDEAFFFIPPTEDAVYLVSDRPGGIGHLDIYRVIPNPIKPKPKFIAFRGEVLDAETGQPVRREPDASLSSNSENLQNTGTARKYAAMAPIGKMIRVSAGADGYANGSVESQAPSEFDSVGFRQDIKLVPAKVKIVGHVTNAFTGKALQAEVVLHEEGGGKSSAQSDGSSGSYSHDAKVFSKYMISCDVKDYEPYESPIEIPLKREALITIQKEIRMTPSGIPPVMVNFDYDKSDLKPDESPKLSHFIEQVKQNPNVRLEISGHTDSHGSEELNKILSTKRANTVVDYLLAHGVAKDQVAVVEGKGKSELLVEETSEDARFKNRRVEVHIMGKQ